MPVELPLHIREHIDTFTGRTWLLPKLQTWLSERNERVFPSSIGDGPEHQARGDGDWDRPNEFP